MSKPRMYHGIYDVGSLLAAVSVASLVLWGVEKVAEFALRFALLIAGGIAGGVVAVSLTTLFLYWRYRDSHWLSPFHMAQYLIESLKKAPVSPRE